MEKVNGVSIERVGSGEPLLLIHGTGGTRFHWTPVVGPLAEQRELLLVDLPGHGESAPPPAGVPHTPIGYAAILADTLIKLNPQYPTVGKQAQRELQEARTQLQAEAPPSKSAAR